MNDGSLLVSRYRGKTTHQKPTTVVRGERGRVGGVGCGRNERHTVFVVSLGKRLESKFPGICCRLPMYSRQCGRERRRTQLWGEREA